MYVARRFILLWLNPFDLSVNREGWRFECSVSWLRVWLSLWRLVVNLYIYIYIYIYKYKFNNNKYKYKYILFIFICIYKFKTTKVRKLKTHFFRQIFRCLYEIFYSVYGSNILQKDILTAIIKSKLNEIKE